MSFEVLMNQILINIFEQFVARNVTFNFIDNYIVCVWVALCYPDIYIHVCMLNNLYKIAGPIQQQQQQRPLLQR